MQLSYTQTLEITPSSLPPKEPSIKEPSIPKKLSIISDTALPRLHSDETLPYLNKTSSLGRLKRKELSASKDVFQEPLSISPIKTPSSKIIRLISKEQSFILEQSPKSSIPILSTFEGLTSTFEGLTSQEKELETFLSTIKDLIKKKFQFTPEEWNTLLKIEYQVRTYSGSSSLVIEAQKWMSEIVVPYVKEQIKNRSSHADACAAAMVGQAYTAFSDLMKSDTQYVEKNVNSLTFVGLDSSQNWVVKEMPAISEEEEVNARALLHLMKKTPAVVEGVKIQELSTKRFGFHRLSQIARTRGISFDSIDDKLLSGLLTVTKEKDLHIFKNHPKKQQLIEQRKEEQYFRILGEGAISYTFSGEDTIKTTAKELLYFYLNGKLILENDSFILEGKKINFKLDLRAVNTLRLYLKRMSTPKEETDSLFFTPDLSDPKIKKAYERCEKFKWKLVKDSDTELSFRQLHLTILREGLSLDKLNVCPVLTPGKKGPKLDTLKKALSVSWNISFPTIVKAEKTKDELVFSSFHHVHVKPFIKGLELLSKLQQEKTTSLFDYLSPEQELDLCLSTILQLADCHSGNIGIVSKSPLLPLQIRNLRVIENEHVQLYSKFEDFVNNVLKGKHKKTATVTFEDELGIKKSYQLDRCPELLSILNKKSPIFFDLDRCLYQSNALLKYQKKAKEVGHLVPVRSALLDIPWAYNPLSRKCLALLFLSLQNLKKRKDWINYEDAPIRKRLSQKANVTVNQFLTSYLKQSLYVRKHGRLIKPLKEWRVVCAGKLAEINRNTQDFWEMLQKELSYVVVRRSTDWITLSKRYKQKVETLKELNPEFSSLTTLPPGSQVKVSSIDLLSTSSASLRNRIAIQLMPRLNPFQKEALEERVDQLIQYLSLYDQLITVKPCSQEMIKKMYVALTSSCCPLNSIKKKEFLQQLSAIQTTPSKQNLLALYRVVMKALNPTYLNIISSMYPLAADVFELGKLTQNQLKIKFSVFFGDLNGSLETLINEGLKDYSPTRPTPKGILAMGLKTKVEGLSASL